MLVNVAIFTEGSHDIGSGHVIRCSSLYQAFMQSGIVPKMFIRGDKTLDPLVNRFNHEYVDWQESEDVLQGMLDKVDVAIVDSYLARDVLYNVVSCSVPVPVFLDDNMRIDYPRGIIINGAVYARELPYPRSLTHVHLLGPGYSPLRPEFSQRKEKMVRRTVKKVLLTFGGTDVRKLMPAFLALLYEYASYEKHILVGPLFTNVDAIVANADKRTIIHQNPNEKDIKMIMDDVDLAISACGTTLYELASVGVPTIGVGVADNQVRNIDGFIDAGFLKFAGWWDDEGLIHKTRLLLTALESQAERQNLSNAGRSLVDGNGSSAIVASILDHHAKSRGGLAGRDAREKSSY